jgi:hypothetical protein
MKNLRAKKKAVAAIRKIVNAAKELAKAEQAYYNRKPKTPRKLPVLTAMEKISAGQKGTSNAC